MDISLAVCVDIVEGTVHRGLQFLFFACITALLTSCVKMQAVVDVRANGAGTLGIALGLTQQAKSLLSTQGQDPLSQLAQRLGLSPSIPLGNDVSVSRWTDGDYDWTKLEKGFKDLDELNAAVGQTGLFQRFSITEDKELLRNQFTLDAQMSPLAALGGQALSPNALGDPSKYIEAQVAVGLPGRIIQTNGVVSPGDPSHMVWTIQGDQPITLTAVSESWNWLIILLICGAFLVVILIVAFGVTAFLARRRSAAKPDGTQMSTGQTPP